MAEVAIADFDFMLNSKNALILLNTYNFEINKKTYDYLKEQQIRCLRFVYEKRDLVACLPTG